MAQQQQHANRNDKRRSSTRACDSEPRTQVTRHEPARSPNLALPLSGDGARSKAITAAPAEQHARKASPEDSWTSTGKQAHEMAICVVEHRN